MYLYVKDYDEQLEELYKSGYASDGGLLVQYETGQRGSRKMIYSGHGYICAKIQNNRKYWVCAKQRSKNCKARLVTDIGETQFNVRNMEHTHPITERYLNSLYANIENKK
ncbi:uncharacterized protein LOC129915353 [Episyrphus balteatus]|uniref:uncharacterized protein LOC129915353 n=1 Tax=Episyrphus balteatus TaxID=286459 RepID=UPI0024859B4E|nr:uncharacterized protein LOC129915353 [Episyrphus balteatus]